LLIEPQKVASPFSGKEREFLPVRKQSEEENKTLIFHSRKEMDNSN
jgi:hypothetical protein